MDKELSLKKSLSFEEVESNIRENISSAKNVLNQLKHIGEISDVNSFKLFLDFLNHKSRDVRVESVKHLGKYKNDEVEKTIVNQFKIEVYFPNKNK
jgi:hypothetical protein